MEAASSHAAREAARADAKARAAKKKDPAQAQLLEVERLKVQGFSFPFSEVHMQLRHDLRREMMHCLGWMSWLAANFV